MTMPPPLLDKPQDLAQGRCAPLEKILALLIPDQAWPSGLSVTGLANICDQNPNQNDRISALTSLLEHVTRSDPTPVINHAQVIDRMLAEKMIFASAELVMVLPLDGTGRPLAQHRLSEGSIDRCSIPLRSLVRYLLNLNAHRFVLAHNHPSGDPTPSEQDRLISRRIQRHCAPLDLTLVDHVVIARSGFASALYERPIQKRSWLHLKVQKGTESSPSSPEKLKPGAFEGC